MIADNKTSVMKVHSVIVIDRVGGVMCLVDDEYLHGACCFLLLAMLCWELPVLLLC